MGKLVGKINMPEIKVEIVSTRLTLSDRLGDWKARWTMGRMDYRVNPGLYGVGQPDNQSPVLVTANYKMTFNSLRSELGGISAWILVLDTKGINVWCAAGKGTFGTKELVRRIRAVSLDKRLAHRVLILPQLGAPVLPPTKSAGKPAFRSSTVQSELPIYRPFLAGRPGRFPGDAPGSLQHPGSSGSDTSRIRLYLQAAGHRFWHYVYFECPWFWTLRSG